MAKKEMAKKESAGYDAVKEALVVAESKVDTLLVEVVKLENELSVAKNQVAINEGNVISLGKDLKKLEKHNG